MRETFRRRTSRIMRVLSVVLALLMTVGGFGIVVSQSAEGWDNHAPTANANGPYKVEVGNNLDLDGTMSTDPDAGYGDSITSYSWDIKADGTWDFTGIAGYMTVPWSYLQTLPQPGVSIPIVLQVTDSFGASGSAATTLTIYENRPEAVFTATPIYAACDQAVFFDASGSYHTYPGRFIISYQWDFGDYTPLAFGVTATHSFYRYGSFTVTLTVTDNNVPPKTDSATASISVNLGNVPPNANAGGPYVLSAGSNLILNGASSSDPNAGCGDSIVSYDWDIMADGTWDFSGSYPTVPWSYLQTLPQPGVSIPIVLQVHDRFWASGSAATTLTILGRLAVADSGPDLATSEGVAVMLDGSGSRGSWQPSGDAAIVSYEWDFENDGTFDYVETAGGAPDGTFDGRTTHVYGDDGVYTVLLRVTDSGSSSDTDQAMIVVNNLVPIGNIGEVTPGVEGSLIVFTATATDDGSDDLTFSWNWGDGTTSTTAHYNDGVGPDLDRSPSGTRPFTVTETLGHTYGDNSVHTVTLTILDDDGGSVVYTTDVTVNNVAPTIHPFGPYVVNEGSLATFQATATDPGSDDLTFTWYFRFGWTVAHDYYGDGTYPVKATDTVGHTYPDNGLFSLTLTVADDGGGTTTYTTSVAVMNVAPAADADGPFLGYEGSPISLSGSAIDPGADVLTYEWDLDNDGQYDDAIGQTPVWTWDDDDDYMIGLRVTDDDGEAGAASTTVNVINIAPTVTANGPYSGFEGSAIALLGSATDPGDDTLTYQWELDEDGLYDDATGPSADWTWFDDGVFAIGLRVVDDDGGAGTYSSTVAVANVAPTAEANGPYFSDEGTAVFLTSYGTDPGADGLTYAWDLDDDGLYDDAASPAAWTWYEQGVYTVWLKVTDDDGGEGIDATTVTVSNVAPIAYAGGPYSADEGAAIILSGYAIDPGYDAQVYEWDLDDDGVYDDATGESPARTWNDDGVYEVGLRVTDDDGAAGTTSTTVTIFNVAPIATANGPYSGEEGTPILLSGFAMDPGADPLTYSWDMDGDGAYDDATGPSPAWTWYDNGPYTVGLEVSDDDGGVGTASALVALFNIAPTITALDVLPHEPVRIVVGTVTLSGQFTDPGAEDTHSASIDWEDGTVPLITALGGSDAGFVTGSHVYAQAGVYTVTLTVTDDDGGRATAVFQFVVVYDPNAGFVTGGGWINSPLGAYAPDPTLMGKATFGFVSKYLKGAKTPSGQTEFQFKVAGLNFKSGSYEWLVVAGARAQFKGTGTINDGGNYGFVLTAVDGQLSGGGGADLFRMKIWDKTTGTVVYDNLMDADDGAPPTTTLGGGSIVIHKK